MQQGQLILILIKYDTTGKNERIRALLLFPVTNCTWSLLLYLAEVLSASFLVSVCLTQFPSDCFLKFKKFRIEDFRRSFINVHLKHEQKKPHRKSEFITCSMYIAF